MVGHGCRGSSATDVFAGGRHYDGTTWASTDSSSDVAFTALWGSSPADIYGVSHYSGTILHYNGSTWSPLETGSETDPFFGIWGSSPDEVFAVGANGKILHYSTACSVKALPELIYNTRRTAPFVQKFALAFDDGYPAKGSILTWDAEAFKTLSVIKTGSKTVTARVRIDPFLWKAGKIRFTFGDCSGVILVDDDFSDIDGTLWSLKNGSFDSDWYDREEVGFHGGKMYWRSTSNHAFDKAIGFSMTSAGRDGDRRYCGFLINPKSLKRPAMYIVWGRINISKPALTMKAIGIAGILPDFVRLHPDFNRKITFLRKLETGWSPPLACPPVLMHLKTVSHVGTFDGEKLWVLGYDLSGKPVLEGIANLEETDYFLPETAVTLPLPDNQTIQGIAVDGDSIWYTEGFTERIYQITQAGELVTSFPAPGKPRGIFVQNGTIWYVARQSRTVYKCDMSGHCAKEISLFLEEPYGIAFDGTHFWVSDSLYGKILYRIDMKGNIADLIYTPTGGGIRTDQLATPYSISLSGSSLWVFGGGLLNDIYELDITALQELPAGTAAN